MSETITAQLTAFNQIYKETDQIYHNYARRCGLSDAAFWVLYCLWEHGDGYLQRELCEDWSYSPQTVNSALKNLETQELIEHVFAKGNKKSKEIHLTQKGRQLGEKIIQPLMQAEVRAFSRLSEREREELLTASRKNIQLLQEEINRNLQTI